MCAQWGGERGREKGTLARAIRTLTHGAALLKEEEKEEEEEEEVKGTGATILASLLSRSLLTLY